MSEHDISKLDSIPSLVSEVEKSIGPINYLINNAGMHLRKIAIETSDQEWKDILDTNLNSVLVYLENVQKNDPKKSGNIILVGSVTTIMGLQM